MKPRQIWHSWLFPSHRGWRTFIFFLAMCLCLPQNLQWIRVATTIILVLGKIIIAPSATCAVGSHILNKQKGWSTDGPYKIPTLGADIWRTNPKHEVCLGSFLQIPLLTWRFQGRTSCAFLLLVLCITALHVSYAFRRILFLGLNNRKKNGKRTLKKVTNF